VGIFDRLNSLSYYERTLCRYDLLCIEGISRALRIFLKKDQPPHYRLAYPPGGDDDLLTVKLSAEVRWIESIKVDAPLIRFKDEKNPTVLRLCHPAWY